MLGKISQAAALQGELDASRARIAALEAAAVEAARRDPVTATLSLAVFREQAVRELERARRSGEMLAALVVDLDGFRELNARHGTAVGDAALRGVAERLTALLAPNALAARSGADELAVLLVGAGREDARTCGTRLVESLDASDVVGAGRVTVSVGVAGHDRGETLERLLARAGSGVDRARAAGGSRVASVDDARDPREVARLDARKDVVEALAVALLERDRYTGEHSSSVVSLSRDVARDLGLTDDAIELVGAGALLHDIGKVAIPDEILRKPTSLDAGEWALMHEHPVIGERILRAIPGMGDVARIVRHEHERIDGHGYPDRLRGEEIPLGSRIILACDAYHAMISDRPYRDARPHGEAIRELARFAGVQFDPRVTEALIGRLHHRVQSGELKAG